MKEVNITFKFEDDQYQMISEEASSINMSVEELIANAFAVIFQEIEEDIRIRKNVDEQKAQQIS